MRVREWMTPDPVVVNPRASALNARRLLERYQVGHLPVIDDGGRLVGIVSRRDLQVPDHQVVSPLTSLEWDLLIGRYRAIATVMRRPVVVTSPQESIAVAAEAMVARRIGALPVLDGGELVGMLSLSDCVRALLDRQRGEPDTAQRPGARSRPSTVRGRL